MNSREETATPKMISLVPCHQDEEDFQKEFLANQDWSIPEVPDSMVPEVILCTSYLHSPWSQQSRHRVIYTSC